jgi:hypothetical protein
MISIAFVDLRHLIIRFGEVFSRNCGGWGLWSFLFVVNVSVLSEAMFLLMYSLQVGFVHSVSRGGGSGSSVCAELRRGRVVFFCMLLFGSVGSVGELVFSGPSICRKARIPNGFPGLSEVFSADAACVAACQSQTFCQ